MVPLCSYWPAEARSQPSPGGYWDACWGLAQEASSEDRWQLRNEKNQNVYMCIVIFSARSSTRKTGAAFSMLKHVTTSFRIMLCYHCVYSQATNLALFLHILKIQDSFELPTLQSETAYATTK